MCPFPLKAFSLRWQEATFSRSRNKTMSIHCLHSTHLRGLVCSFGFSLGLPAALGLCILAGPKLGLPNMTQTGDCRLHPDDACEAADLGRNIPTQPRSDMDVIRIQFAWRQYRQLVHSQRAFQACLRSPHSAGDRRGYQNAVVEFQDEYCCVYQEVTPEGRRRAHLPPPEESALNTQSF